ncbi:hypothetical protein OAA12_02095 [Akkermansiaceae bacterium]|nr:hypothetical protein [Akkermansiaceae bacterium]
MKTYQTLVVALTAGTLTLISCSPIQQPYDLGGAAAGAALSNNTAGNRNDIARSAAPGGAAGTGYAVYRERQNQNNGTYPNGSYTVAPPHNGSSSHNNSSSSHNGPSSHNSSSSSSSSNK